MGGRQHTTAKELLTVNNIRVNNKINILTDIVKQTDITRNDLARKNHISIMTVKHIVDELIERALVEEHTCRTAVGRKPMALNIAGAFGNIVCINLTSTNEIGYLVYDLKENILADRTFKKGRQTYKNNLLRMLNDLKAYLTGIPTKTVGIVAFVASAYYEEKDIVNYDLIPEFKDIHLKALLKENFDMDNILVLHDAFAAAKSEYEDADSANDSQFFFYCGAGVGGFFIHKGDAVMGDSLVAGEVGKMLLYVDPHSRTKVTVEEEISIPAVLSKLHKVFGEVELAEALSRYEQGEEAVCRIIDGVLNTAAQVLYNIMWLYNPTRIVIDSCCKQYAALIKERTEKFLETYKDESIPIQVKIKKARYDEYHTMRGCYKIALEKWIEEVSMEERDIL